MACPQCGNQEIRQYKLCNQCIAARQSHKQASRQAVLTQHYQEDSKLDQALSSPITWIAAGIAAFIVMLVLFTFVGPVSGKGPLASLFFSGILLCAAAALIARWLITVRKWGGRVGFHECKSQYLVQYGAVAGGLLFSVLLSSHLKLTMAETQAMVESYIYDEQFEGESYGEAESDLYDEAYYFEEE